MTDFLRLFALLYVSIGLPITVLTIALAFIFRPKSDS